MRRRTFMLSTYQYRIFFGGDNAHVLLGRTRLAEQVQDIPIILFILLFISHATLNEDDPKNGLIISTRHTTFMLNTFLLEVISMAFFSKSKSDVNTLMNRSDSLIQLF